MDCGGGTVDITINKILCEPDEKFLLNEVLSSTGRCKWGSKYVEHNFEEFFERIFRWKTICYISKKCINEN